MKIALVHDDLIQMGGAERLLIALTELYPDAPVYTSFASKKWLSICSEKGIKLQTSFMQSLPFKEKLFRLYALFLFYPLAFESFDFSDFDLVVSISARFSHGILTKPGTIHICYMNSPGRMIWETSDYFRFESTKVKKVIKILPTLTTLRLWDYISAQKVDYFIANSSVPKNRILRYYHRNSHVIYPFVDNNITELGLKATETKLSGKQEKLNNQEFEVIQEKVLSKAQSSKINNLHINEDYYLIISRLLPWKQISIAIEACKTLDLALKVIGEGPDKERLQKLIEGYPNIELLGYVSEDEKIHLLSLCKAFIVTQLEDFGITPLEAMMSGKPVIAYGKGGVLDTVVPGVTGEFYFKQSSETLIQVLKDFNPKNYLKADCIYQARKFDRLHFDTNIKDYINAVYLKSRKTRN